MGAGRLSDFTNEEIDEYADDLLEWLEDETHIFFKDFCLELNIDPDFMKEWANKNSKFNGAYKIANHRQESRLLNGVLTKGYNNGIATLVLTNKHGYVTSKTESKISGDPLSPLALMVQEAQGTSKDLVNDVESA